MKQTLERHYPFWHKMEKEMARLVAKGQFKNIPVLFRQEVHLLESLSAKIQEGEITLDNYDVPREDSRHGDQDTHDKDLDAWTSNNLIIYFTLMMLNEVIKGRNIVELNQLFIRIKDEVLIPLCENINSAKHVNSSRPLGELDDIGKRFESNWEHIYSYYTSLNSSTVLPKVTKSDSVDSSLSDLDAKEKTQLVADHLVDEYAPKIKSPDDGCIRTVKFDAKANLLIVTQKNNLTVLSGEEKTTSKSPSINVNVIQSDRRALLYSGSAFMIAGAIAFIAISLAAPAFPLSALILVVLGVAVLGGGLGFAARNCAQISNELSSAQDESIKSNSSYTSTLSPKAFGHSRHPHYGQPNRASWDSVANDNTSHDAKNAIPMVDLSRQPRDGSTSVPEVVTSTASLPLIFPHGFGL